MDGLRPFFDRHKAHQVDAEGGRGGHAGEHKEAGEGERAAEVDGAVVHRHGRAAVLREKLRDEAEANLIHEEKIEEQNTIQQLTNTALRAYYKHVWPTKLSQRETMRSGSSLHHKSIDFLPLYCSAHHNKS
eukprot:scaffold44546_cov34-Prasinocladus_malaysianus.AAC.1